MFVSKRERGMEVASDVFKRVVVGEVGGVLDYCRVI
jgi:hypothetical protein